MAKKLESTNQFSFPQPTLPEFMGAYAPISHCHGSQYQQENTNFFQDYRNETLSRFMMPSYEWGLMKTPYSSRSDLVSAYKKANWKCIAESSTVKLRLIDEARMNEVDNFYKVCQMHRDQYRDLTDTLHPLTYFQCGEYLWQNSPNLTRLYLAYPKRYIQYSHPLVLPKSYQRATPIPTLPDRTLAGRYFHGSDNSYNR